MKEKHVHNRVILVTGK